MRGIGDTARASGLSVSALRFYDGAGVLVPAMVDPATGYRWYAEHQVRAARLVAGLRRVGMPLAEISRVLGQLGQPDEVRRLLDAHLRRLEDGLTDARREFSRVHALLDSEETLMSAKPTRVAVSGGDLIAALAAVRFAVGDDPELPALTGVLIEVEPSGLHLVATDRYRLAVSHTPLVELDGPPARVLVPASFVDQLRALVAGTGTGTVTLTVSAGTVAAEKRGRQVSGQPLDTDFPDYRRLLGEQVGDAHRVTVDVPALRRALAPGAAPEVVREHGGIRHEVAVLAVDPAGKLTVADEDSWRADPDAHVAVNREFLLEALDAGGGGQLVLGLDGPIRPLAVRKPDNEQTFSILMPIRL